MGFPVLYILVFIASILTGVSGVCDLGQDVLQLSDWAGSLTSPGYTSGQYPSDQDCTWNIRVSQGSKIKLTFTLFQLEDGTQIAGRMTCSDQILIIDNVNNVTLLEACGTKLDSPSFTSSGNDVTVKFLTDNKVSPSKAGFRLEYSGVCAMVIDTDSVLETPNYPGAPPDGVKCAWEIKQKKNSAAVIQLNNQTNNLPSCNISPLKVRENAGRKKQHTLCLVESKSLIFKDVLLTYAAIGDTVPWNGSLKVEYVISPKCEYFCVNAKSCLTPRGLNMQGYRCVCNEGYTGKNCDVKVEILDPCHPKSCRNDGTCVQTKGVFTCSCPANYTGEMCEVAMDPCYPATCLNGGLCESATTGPACACPRGYSGKRCEFEIDPCTTNPCGKNGICSREGPRFACSCAPNYNGPLCNNIIDPCFPNSCINGGRCEINDDQQPPSCACPSEYKGKRCEIKLDPCLAKPCKNNGDCISISDGPGFGCSCPKKFTGRLCELPVEACSKDSCMNDGVCKLVNGMAVCTCPSGFEGLRCERELDLCATKPCLNGGKCISAGKTFSCTCQPTHTGTLCEIVVDACFPNSCQNGGKCADINNSPGCVCTSDYTGLTCEIKIDPCASLPCKNGGECTRKRLSFHCTCSIGFAGDTCERSVSGPCDPNVCMNGGVCSVKNDGNTMCTCKDGYFGAKCEIPVDPCMSKPCKNDGVCNKFKNTFQCTCTAEFKGPTCEVALGSCLSNPCPAKATCIDTPGSYSCQCPPGFTGEICDVNIDNCALSMCQNGGTCVDGLGTFSCVCGKGFTGYLCDSDLDDCASSPCEHGICKDGQGTFQCTCDEDYRGRYCDIHKDQGYCPEERDAIESSRILWYDTIVGIVNVQSCPPNIIGNATRSCVDDQTSPTGGRWTRPDLSECVSPPFVHLALEAALTTNVEDLTGTELIPVASQLRDLTALNQAGDRMLYPGDLRMASTIISLVSGGLKKAHSSEQTSIIVAQILTESMNYIVDPQTLPTWKNARANVVVEGVKLLLTSAETLAECFDKDMYSGRSGGSVDGLNEFKFSGTNLDLKISKISMYAGRSSSSVEDTNPITISLPDAVFNITRQYTDKVSVYSSVFYSIANLLSMKESRYGDDMSESRVNSEIISSKVLGFNESMFSNLSEPVVIAFKIKESAPKNLKNYCVFMNMSATSAEDEWSSNGCELYSSNSTHVTCHCYHLTNFALLLDVYGTSESLDETNNAILSYISYIGGSLSILGCLVAIIVFEYFRLKSDRIRIHEMLAVSIIMVQIVFLIGIGRTTDRTATPFWACKTVAILLHFALTSLFCWMLVEGIHIYVVLVRVFKRGSHFKKYLALGWGVPLVIVGISVGVFYDKYGVGTICWLDRDMLLMCFVPTVGLVVIINAVMLVIVIRVMMRSLNSTAKVNVQEISSLRISVKAAVVLLPLLGLTWILAFLAVNTDKTRVLAYVFTYLFTIGNAFQGLIFFIFHCLMNVDVHSAFERRYRKQKTMDTSSSRARKSSEVDTSIDGKGTLTPKFMGILEKTNNYTVSTPASKFNPNIHFRRDYDEEDENMWRNVSLGDDGPNNQYVLRLRPNSESDPVVTEYINDIQDYLGKPSRHSVQFSSTT